MKGHIRIGFTWGGGTPKGVSGRAIGVFVRIAGPLAASPLLVLSGSGKGIGLADAGRAVAAAGTGLELPGAPGAPEGGMGGGRGIGRGLATAGALFVGTGGAWDGGGAAAAAWGGGGPPGRLAPGRLIAGMFGMFPFIYIFLFPVCEI